MLYAFQFPFVDLRQFLCCDTYKLKKLYLNLDVPDGEIFLRSFGALKNRNRINRDLPFTEVSFANANRAIKFESLNRLYKMDYYNKVNTKCVFKRFFTNDFNCRVDVGIAVNLLSCHNTYDYSISFIRKLFKSHINIPSLPDQAKQKKFSFKKAGNGLASLYLYATTELPSQNFKLTNKEWISCGAPMTLIECQFYDIQTVPNYFTKIELTELDVWGIELYYAIIDGIKTWILKKSYKTEKDKLRNLRIYLFKLHQDRECLKQVLKAMYSMREDINNSVYLSKYLERCTETLNKKKYYGISNNEMISLIDRVDSFVNENERTYILDMIENSNTLKPLLQKIKNSIDMKNKDIFVSHASEDKKEFADPLINKLKQMGLSVWYDKNQINDGDSIRRKIDEGLIQCKFAILVLSKSFFSKKWTQQELDALMMRQMNGTIVIIPVLYNITIEEVLLYSPLIAGIRAVDAKNCSIDQVSSRIYEDLYKES